MSRDDEWQGMMVEMALEEEWNGVVDMVLEEEWKRRQMSLQEQWKGVADMSLEDAMATESTPWSQWGPKSTPWNYS